MKRWAFALAVSIVVVAGAPAQDAKTFLKQVQQKFNQAKTMDMTLDITVELSMGGNSQRQQVKAQTAIQRPNRFQAKINTGMGEQQLFSDGTTMFVYVPSAKQYMKQPAPKDFKGSNIAALGPVGLVLGIADQNLDDPNAKRTFAFKGNQTIAGKQTRIVEVVDNEGNQRTVVRLFIGAQDQLIYRVEATATVQSAQSQGGQQSSPITQKLTADIRYNSFDKPIPASRFRFTPPKDAKEMQAPQQGSGGGAPRR